MEVRYLANFQCMPLPLTLQLLSILFPSTFPLTFLALDLLELQASVLCCALCSLPEIFNISWLLLLEVGTTVCATCADQAAGHLFLRIPRCLELACPYKVGKR